MKIGVVFPQTEFGRDPAAIADYAQTAEALGYTHVLAYDHVVGANPDRPGGWSGPYTHQSSFQEPFVLFAYMAALARQLEFVTGIIILPQRETTLVAKQAATLDVLSNGRFRMGIGVGWNKVEYIALNQEFHNRGKRVEEQIVVLRKLWTEELVNFAGEWHTIPDAGLNPLPVQRPIPIWMGGHADVLLRRVARTGDGWMPNYREAADAQQALDALDEYLAEYGRARSDIGLEARLHYQDGNPDKWHQTFAGWQQAGATHITINTMGSGLQTAQEHIRAITHFAQEMM
jgi:probable F420-dependent oxidoreductase